MICDSNTSIAELIRVSAIDQSGCEVMKLINLTDTYFLRMSCMIDQRERASKGVCQNLAVESVLSGLEFRVQATLDIRFCETVCNVDRFILSTVIIISTILFCCLLGCVCNYHVEMYGIPGEEDEWAVAANTFLAELRLIIELQSHPLLISTLQVMLGRVKSIESKATPQATPIFVIPKAVILQFKDMPAFEEVQPLLLNYDNQDVTFCSHKWFDNKPDLGSEFRKWVEMTQLSEFLWVDYCCTPQSAPEITKIVAAIKMLPKWKFAHYSMSPVQYNLSAWCQFEWAMHHGTTNHVETLRILKKEDVDIMISATCEVMEETGKFAVGPLTAIKKIKDLDDKLSRLIGDLILLDTKWKKLNEMKMKNPDYNTVERNKIMNDIIAAMASVLS